MKKNKLYFYTSMLLATSIIMSQPFYNLEQNIIDFFSDNKEDPDENEAKIICKFLNYKNIDYNDVITIINEKNEIYSILGVDAGKITNDTYIYLPKGKYKIYSSLGFNKIINVENIDNTYELKCDYEKNEVKFSELKKEYYVLKNPTIINDDENTNYISSDLNFLNDTIESSNLDYSNIKKDEFTPQGYVIISGTYPSILITAYSNNDNSRVYIYNKEKGKYLGYISLNNANHVGGITYDPENDVLFITASNGLINTYDYSVLMQALNNGIEIIDEKVVINLANRSDKNQNNNYVIIDNDIDVLQSAATICYYDNALYSIDYGLNSILVKTDYDIIGSKIISTKNEVIIPEDAKCVQGMAFYKNSDNNIYLILSSSSGFLQSKISIYEVDSTYNWKCISQKIIKSSKQIEGISVDKYGNISTIYEGDITNSKIVGNVDKMIQCETYDGNTFNDIGYIISGSLWDLQNTDSLSVSKAKKLIKSQ